MELHGAETLASVVTGTLACAAFDSAGAFCLFVKDTFYFPSLLIKKKVADVCVWSINSFRWSPAVSGQDHLKQGKRLKASCSF